MRNPERTGGHEKIACARIQYQVQTCKGRPFRRFGMRVRGSRGHEPHHLVTFAQSMSTPGDAVLSFRWYYIRGLDGSSQYRARCSSPIRNVRKDTLGRFYGSPGDGKAVLFPGTLGKVLHSICSDALLTGMQQTACVVGSLIRFTSDLLHVAARPPPLAGRGIPRVQPPRKWKNFVLRSRDDTFLEHFLLETRVSQAKPRPKPRRSRPQVAIHPTIHHPSRLNRLNRPSADLPDITDQPPVVKERLISAAACIRRNGMPKEGGPLLSAR
ncbi:hypothetical protein B0T17DRAFT_594577 [Bombardia bombarda]|uniref:Uncharacterized protein n=1 Tax=Bombardia bombarda TaxID=252184 RepID=A0AA39XIZ4_9PEZI|nr:hypothetical protein B0T17DRAFT_594577 [Bombardia bombarda]